MNEVAKAAEEPGAPAARRGRLLVLLPVLVFAAMAALFAVRLQSGDPSRIPSALIGRSAPAVSLPPLADLTDGAGAKVPGLTSESFGGGKVTVLNVWASWCGPCRVEHPMLMDLARDPALRVVGLNYKDRPDAARRFLGALGNPFAALGADADGRAAIEWGVYGVPETFVVSPDGVIRYKHVGPLTPEALPGFNAQLRAAADRK